MNKALATFFIATIVLPFRIRHAFLFFNSISIHDIALVVFGFFLLLLVLYQNGTLYIGNKAIFLLLCVPLSIGILSLAWSRDVLKTTYYLVMVVEAVLSYLIIVNLLHSMKPSSIMKFMSSMFVSIIVVSVLSYLRVPGFAPFIPFEYGSQAYNQYIASYYSRLSSPFLGLSNNLASVVSFFFFLSWAWYIISRRRGYLILSILTFLAIIMTMSRGVFLAIILTIPFFILWQKIKVTKLIPLLISVVLLTAALVAVINVSNESFRVHALPRLDIYRTIVIAGVERLQRAAYAIEQIIESPLYGYGARLTLDAVDPEEVFIGNVHNTYLEQMLWFGVPLGYRYYLCR